MTTRTDGGREGAFIVTKEHRRFVEFANAVRQHRYIGLCFGPAGVGKTLSARRYARWDEAEPIIEHGDIPEAEDTGLQGKLARSRTVFHTPAVLGTLRDLRDNMANRLVFVSACVEEQLCREGVKVQHRDRHRLVEMVIIDEAERLATSALELVRDIFDRTGMGVILIGMPGMEKRLSRYPQLYSRVGFAHHYCPLQGNELTRCSAATDGRHRWSG
jgi:DNA transposition AAA+ family ATPase